MLHLHCRLVKVSIFRAGGQWFKPSAGKRYLIWPVGGPLSTGSYNEKNTDCFLPGALDIV